MNSLEPAGFRDPGDAERRLLCALVQQVPHLNGGADWLDGVRVQPMDDGGMGSFRIAPRNGDEERRSFGGVAATLEFADEDGVRVLVSLNTDTRGEPLEVDVWKTDFSPVIRVPDVLPVRG